MNLKYVSNFINLMQVTIVSDASHFSRSFWMSCVCVMASIRAVGLL